jgi:chemotaxis protein CheD
MKKKITIHIGELYATTRPMVIHTLVGSCVSVCLFDPDRQIGGMNHILLPGRADMTKFDAPARYGIYAMELLINKIMKLGGNRHGLIAKIFGGAHLLPAISYENGIGRKNVAFVLEFLRNESIRIISYDLEGHESRRIYFHTDTGDVFLKRIYSHYYPALALQEKKLFRRAKRESEKPAEISFFNKNGYGEKNESDKYEFFKRRNHQSDAECRNGCGMFDGFGWQGAAS